MNDVRPIRRALLSVTDKTGVVELARSLAARGVELVSTGGTRAVLESAGLKVVPIENLTGLPEAFGGRMKTLSFHVLSGILFRRDEASDQAQAQALEIPEIDLVVVNFYAFEQTAQKERGEQIEAIDIGGPTLVRAAAKNHDSVLVLTDPTTYSEFIAEFELKGGSTFEFRKASAARAWVRVAQYDADIASRFAGEANSDLELRYGENPHQRAVAFLTNEAGGAPMDWSKPYGGKALSFNNIGDLAEGYAIVSELLGLGLGSTPGKPGAVAVVLKHGQPCGCAIRSTIEEAVQAAWDGDPTSAFGGVWVLSQPLTVGVVEFLKSKFVEAIAAPQSESTATLFSEWHRAKPGVRGITIRAFQPRSGMESRTFPGLRVFQAQDSEDATAETLEWKSGSEQPQDRAAIAFGTTLAKFLRSNAVVIVGRTLELLGVGAGQPNRIDAVLRLALPRAGARARGAVLVSDAFFPFPDSIDAAADAGVGLVVQPGGSIRDGEIVARAKERGIGLVFSSCRHFRH